MARVKTEKKLFVVYNSSDDEIVGATYSSDGGKVFASEKEAREYVQEQLDEGNLENADDIVVCELTPISKAETNKLSWRNVDKFED